MDSFVAAVDRTQLPEEVRNTVVTALQQEGFGAPEQLAGTSSATIDKLVGQVGGPAGGLMKRTFDRAEDVVKAKRIRAAPPGSAIPSGQASGAGQTGAHGQLTGACEPVGAGGTRRGCGQSTVCRY